MRRRRMLIVFTNDHIERPHGLLSEALHRVVLEAGGLGEGWPAVEGTDPGLMRSFIFLVSQASDVVPVLLAGLETCLTVRTVMSRLRLHSGSTGSTVSFVHPECLNTAPHPLITVRTQEWSGWSGPGGAGGHLRPLSLAIPSLGVVMEGVVHVDQPGDPVDIVVAGGRLHLQVWVRIHFANWAVSV